jgi:hypothetical protein
MYARSLVPPKDPTFAYYQQYCQLTIANMVMHQQIKKLIQESKGLKATIIEQSKVPEVKPIIAAPESPVSKEILYQYPSYDSKRRHRRAANEVERTSRCPFSGCGKAYG